MSTVFFFSFIIQVSIQPFNVSKVYVMTGLMETVGKPSKCLQNKIHLTRWDLFVVVKLMMRKYLYNNHHIDVNLEPRNDMVLCFVVLPLRLRKECIVFVYSRNTLWWTSQGGEIARWRAWCNFPINIEGLMLLPWCSMLNNLDFVRNRDLADRICALSASCWQERTCKYQSGDILYNATCLVIRQSVYFFIGT